MPDELRAFSESVIVNISIPIESPKSIDNDENVENSMNRSKSQRVQRDNVLCLRFEKNPNSDAPLAKLQLREGGEGVNVSIQGSRERRAASGERVNPRYRVKHTS